MPPTMGGPTEAGRGGPIVKALAVANAAVRKPRSGMKLSVRLERQASKDIAARQEARTPSSRIGVALLAN
jgi:hypothetical protein